MNKQSNLAIDYAMAQIDPVTNDILGLPLVLQTVLVVHAAQGLIDNGGLQYFFEKNFVGMPKYSVFSDAYRRIDANDAATIIDKAVQALFPFPNPQMDEDKRQAILEMQRGNRESDLEKLTGKICGDETVWEKLEQYILANRNDFGNVFNQS